jgi:hypothetical protein
MILTFIESLIVGVYSTTIYLFIFHIFLKYSWNLELFLTGFIKHLLGNILHLQQLFCIYHYKINHTPQISLSLLIQSFAEGIIFVILGSIIYRFLKNKGICMFIIGASLHIIAEIVGIHRQFCVAFS